MSATPDSTLANPEQRIADLERQLAERENELAECKAERDEALEQHTAIAEVLKVIDSSPGDLSPVFDAILEKAMRLCEAPFGALRRFDGEAFQAMAARDTSGAVVVVLSEPTVPDSGSASERLVLGDDVVHIPGCSRYGSVPLRGALAAEVCRSDRCAHRVMGRLAEQGRFGWGPFFVPPRGAAILKQADRAIAEFRRASGHCNGECAALD